jgi:hypothetical protein
MTIIAMALLVSGCALEEPQAPTWETTWDMPLTNKTYDIEELVDEMDSEDIVFDSLGNPSFSITQDVDTVSVEDNLTADAVNQTYEDSLDVVDIDSPTMDPETFNMTSLGIPNVAGSVPADTSFNETRALTTIDNFDWAVIHEGTMRIEIANDMGIDLDTLVVTLYNSSDLGTPLSSAVFENGVADDETLSRDLELDGETIENQLTIITTGVALAQGISAPSNDMVVTTTFPGGLTVSSALAEIPGFTKNLDQVIDMEDSSIIYTSLIDQGSMSIQIVNGSALPMDLDLTFPNFEFNSTTLTISESVSGNSVVTRNVNLNGYNLIPDGTSAPQTISVNVTANIEDSAPLKYQVNATDSLKVIADVSDITFESITGQIEPTTVDIDPMREDVDVPDGFEDATLTHAQLRVNLFNNSTSDVFVDMVLENENGTKSVAIQDTARGKSSLIAEARETEILVSSLSLSTFLDPTPAEIVITGSAIMNPAQADSVTIHKDDFFYGNVEIYSPLAFALSDTSEIDLDVTDAEGAGDDSPDFEETFNYGNIRAELTSHLPVGMKVSLYMGLYEDDRIFTDPNSLVIGPFVLQSATTDVNGYAIEEISSVFNDSLTSEEISIFENEEFFIAPKVQLLPTTGAYITGSDYFRISATARLSVNAGEHLWEDEDDN